MPQSVTDTPPTPLAETKYLLVFENVPADGDEFLITTFVDGSGLVSRQTVDRRVKDAGHRWSPLPDPVPAPGTEPATGRSLAEVPC
jgi:hypothetical protein